MTKALQAITKASKTPTTSECNEPISVEESNELIPAQLTESALEPDEVVISVVVGSNHDECVEGEVMVENIGRVDEAFRALTIVEGGLDRATK